MGGPDEEKFSSNSASYSQRLVTQEQLRATQEELATKIRELQIYEANYIQLKKDLARWKKKFEYIFRENELLSLETAKLDASHKQIAFLQQEIKFKEEEATALRGLVSALETSNKKARASRLDSVARQTSFKSVALGTAPEPPAAAAASSGDQEELLRERKDRAEEKERHLAEIAALKQENGMLLKDLDRKDGELQLQGDKVSAHKDRISTLEQTLQSEQNTNLERMREKQDRIADLEVQVAQLEQRRRSSAAMLAKVEEEVGFGVISRLNSGNLDRTDEERESGADLEPPDTPPGTPPPISAGGLLPIDDPNADQIVKDWVIDRKIRAAPSIEGIMDHERLADFVEKLPYDAREGAQRLLEDVLDTENGSQINESQILLRAVPNERQKEMQEFLVPLLKAHHGVRVTYSTLQRRTLVTDVRLTLERRSDSVTGGVLPGEKRFGRDHAFLGPSAEDVAKLVAHTTRVISSGSKAIYVSKPKHVDPPVNADGTSADSPVDTERSSLTNRDSVESGSGLPPAPAPSAGPGPNRKWRGISAAKFIGTMAAGAKQRVAARFASTKFVHEGTSCQFCKTSPIVGPRYSCQTCVGFDLCETCYALGGHGLENSDELFYRVQELVLARCPRLGLEMDLLELLRFEICRANLRKFSFCLNWLADIVNGKSSRELQARALEIPSIRRDVRKQFVPLLLTVCSDREDIEVKTEWELEDDNAAAVRSVVRGSLSEGDGRFLETLRIWVADQYRTTSPFVERSLLQYKEGEGEEDEDGEGEGGDANGMSGDDHAGSNHLEPPSTPSDAGDQPGFLERNHIQKEEF